METRVGLIVTHVKPQTAASCGFGPFYTAKKKPLHLFLLPLSRSEQGRDEQEEAGGEEERAGGQTGGTESC